MEWLIGFIPLPYVVACLLLATLISLPGQLLAGYLDGRSTELPYLPSEPVNQLSFVVSMIVNGLIIFYLFYTVRFMRSQVMEVSGRLAPLTSDDGKTLQRTFAPLSSFGPPLIVGIGATVLLHVLLFLSQGDTFVGLMAFLLLNYPAPAVGPFFATRIFFANLLYVPAIGTFLWVYFRAHWGLHVFGQARLRLKPYHEDSMLGLRPMGSLSLILAGVYFVWVILVALSSLPDPDLFDVVYPIPLVAVGVVMFFLPLTNVHRAMTTMRGKEQNFLQEWFSKILGAANPPGSKNPEGSLLEVSHLLSELRGVLVLDILRREVAGSPTWPFDTAIVRRLIVLVTSVTTSLIAHLLQVTLRV